MNAWDVIVIGAGQTGSPLAARLAEKGRSVLLVERLHLGGTCVNYGCTPTKTMIASARAAHVARSAGRLGVRVDQVRVDMEAVVRRKDAKVLQWRQAVERRVAGAGVKLIKGHARFGGERRIEVDGERHTAETVVINVGTRPVVPRVPGLDQVSWLDNTTVMDLREVPTHLLVLGGGFIGCEFGQAFRRFGAEVTIVDQGHHLLALQDTDISESIEEVFRAEGITLCLGARAASVRRSGSAIELQLDGGQVVRGSHLLVAVGRKPNTDDLACDRAGVQLDERGFIRVDDRYATTAAGVYATGDVTGSPQFTHVAWDDHRLLYDILCGNGTRGRAARLIPHATFTDPQVAGVGLTERQAKEQGIAYEVATYPFGHVARALETEETAGLLKVLIDPESEQIFGATIVGAEAAELIHIIVAAMAGHATARVLVDAEFVHPAYAEGVQSALMRLPRYTLT
jgi:pyruvate/2-oxoglutarate dehydrogenase complex dihydrolipoamide dehydrogenase (E3) component